MAHRAGFCCALHSPCWASGTRAPGTRRKSGVAGARLLLPPAVVQAVWTASVARAVRLHCTEVKGTGCQPLANPTALPQRRLVVN